MEGVLSSSPFRAPGCGQKRFKTKGIIHFMYYARLISKVGRQHTIGPAGQATSSIQNIRIIGRYFERIGDHDESDRPEYPSAFDGKNSRTFLEDIDTWLMRTYGQGNVLLSYVTSERQAVKTWGQVLDSCLGQRTLS